VMKKVSELFVIASGCAVLAAIVVIFYATAYMRSGHPPASGIVALIVLFCVSPPAFLSVVFGLLFNRSETRLNPLLAYGMWGVNATFVFIVICLFLFKVILGKPL